jgi:hypothetical protein
VTENKEKNINHSFAVRKILFLVLSLILIGSIILVAPSLNMSGNVKSISAQGSIPEQEEGSNGGEGGEWTGEIEYRNLIDQYPEANEATRSHEVKFNGKFSFNIVECEKIPSPSVRKSLKCVTGNGKGYVFMHEEEHVGKSGSLLYSNCWRHAEGPVTFSIRGDYTKYDRTDTPWNENNKVTLLIENPSSVSYTGKCEYVYDLGDGKTRTEVYDNIPTIDGMNDWQTLSSDIPGLIPYDVTDRAGRYGVKTSEISEYPQMVVENITQAYGELMLPYSVENNALIKLVVPHPSDLPFELKDGAWRSYKVDNNYFKLTLHGPDCETKPEPPKFESYANGLWRLNFGVVDREGLALQDVNIGNSHLLDRLSMPHSEVSFSDGQEHIIRYCSSTDQHIEPELTQDGIFWSFSREFGGATPENTMDDGVLTISYYLVIRSVPVRNCEAGENPCLRLIPTVNFKWDGEDPAFLKQFTAFYKLDYGNRIGLTLVSDRNWIPGPLIHQPFQEKEISFRAVDRGGQGKFDNIHSGHIGDRVHIPGCRVTMYDCLHMHWRWGDPVGKKLDPLVDPLSGATFPDGYEGEPYLVSGQTIDVAVVKASSDPSEQDPDDPLSLVNGETIAVNSADRDHLLMNAEHPIVWYISSVENEVSATFFKHGLFSLDTRGTWQGWFRR